MDKNINFIYKVIEENDFRIEVEIEDFQFYYFEKFYHCKIFPFAYMYLLTKYLALRKIKSFVEAGEYLFGLGIGIKISDFFYEKFCKLETLKNSKKVKINVVVDIPYYSQKIVNPRTSLFYEGNFLYSFSLLGCSIDPITKKAIPHPKEFLEIMEKYKNEIKNNLELSLKPLNPPTNKQIFRFNYLSELSDEDTNKHMSAFSYLHIAINIINIFIKQNKLENFKHDIKQYKLLETSSYYQKETKGNKILNIEFWEENIGNNTAQLKFIFRNEKNVITTYVTLNFNTLLFFQMGMKSLLPEIPEKIIEDQYKYIPCKLDEKKKAMVKVPIFCFSDFDRNNNISIYHFANLNKIHLYPLLNFPFFQKFPIFHQAVENIYTSEIKLKCSNYYYDEFCNVDYQMNSRKLYFKLYFELTSYTENSITLYKKYTYEENVVAEIEETISELDPEIRNFKQIPKEIYQELQQELPNPKTINTKFLYPPKNIKTIKIEIPVQTYTNDDDTNGYITHIPYLKYAYNVAGIFCRKNLLSVLKVDVGHYRLLDTSMIFMKEIKGSDENIFFEGWEDNFQMPLKSILNLNLKDRNENLLAFVSFEFNPELFKIGTKPITQKLISKL